jgi:hypothetical protein
MRSMAPRGMAPGHPPQAGTGCLGARHEPGRRPDTTAFAQMVADLLRSGFRERRRAQGGATALGQLLPTAATAPQAETVMAIHLPDHEGVRASLAKPRAFGMPTGERVHVGSLPVGLRAHSWSLSHRLHPTRHCPSTPSAIIPGHYR